jgi:hypothetical protein
MDAHAVNQTLDTAWYRQFSGAMKIARGGRKLLNGKLPSLEPDG